MSTLAHPFDSSASVAAWAATVLRERGIDHLADWRMLEYWMNVELYGALLGGRAGAWRHLGQYEQPYVTRYRVPGRKTDTKWIDLVLGWPSSTSPSRVIWIELKDLGRNPSTLVTNCKGLGKDLAALLGIRKPDSLVQLRQPTEFSVDRGRLKEWSDLADAIEAAEWWIGQVVIVRKETMGGSTADDLVRHWRDGFERRLKNNRPPVRAPMLAEIAQDTTDEFIVFASVKRLSDPQQREQETGQ